MTCVFNCLFANDGTNNFNSYAFDYQCSIVTLPATIIYLVIGNYIAILGIYHAKQNILYNHAIPYQQSKEPTNFNLSEIRSFIYRAEIRSFIITKDALSTIGKGIKCYTLR